MVLRHINPRDRGFKAMNDVNNLVDKLKSEVVYRQFDNAPAPERRAWPVLDRIAAAQMRSGDQAPAVVAPQAPAAPALTSPPPALTQTATPQTASLQPATAPPPSGAPAPVRGFRFGAEAAPPAAQAPAPPSSLPGRLFWAEAPPQPQPPQPQPSQPQPLPFHDYARPLAGAAENFGRVPTSADQPAINRGHDLAPHAAGSLLSRYGAKPAAAQPAQKPSADPSNVALSDVFARLGRPPR